MGNVEITVNRIRERIRAERERRGLSQADLAALMANSGIAAYGSTVAKIESGDRSIRVEEIIAIADIFGLSVDTLTGRRGNASDLVWAVSKLSSNAQRMAGEVAHLGHRFGAEVEDVRLAAAGEQVALLDQAIEVAAHLASAKDALNKLAGQFPLPGSPT